MLPLLIPIFPLPDLVLFPGVFLPLHIFEVRYREMVKDVLAGDRMIGMALLKAGWEHDVSGLPAVYPIGCIGLITHIEELEDGRYNLVLRGVERFRIIEEEGGRVYRQATVEYLSETVTQADRDAIRRERHRLEQLLVAVSSSPDPPFPSNLSDEEVINALAQYLEMEPIERQALLERDGARHRCRALIDLLEMKAMTLSPRSHHGLAH